MPTPQLKFRKTDAVITVLLIPFFIWNSYTISIDLRYYLPDWLANIFLVYILLLFSPFIIITTLYKLASAPKNALNIVCCISLLVLGIYWAKQMWALNGKL